MFKCDKCRECCRNLYRSSIYDQLHNGDGICRYLKGNICSIYESRPLICRVDESYHAFFQDKLTYEDYLQLNYECCGILKSKREETLCQYHYG